MYTNFVYKILSYLFGNHHPIVVVEYFIAKKSDKVKDIVFIHIYPGDKWFARVIGKEGKTIKMIENLVKIKSYLNSCQAIIKVEK